MKKTNEKMTFWEHLEELRTRLIYIVCSLIIGFIIAYIYSKELFDWLTIPLFKLLNENPSINFTSMAEPFIVYIKVGFFGGLFISSPFILYQIWKFIAPGLFKHEKKFVLPFVILTTFFFVGGACFAYFVVFPLGFKFFLSYASQYIKPIITMNDYLNFTTQFMLVFGLIFETPLVVSFLSLTGIINPRNVLAKWRYAIIIIAIVSAILTPPDVGSMLMMALPLTSLYFLSLFFSIMFKRKH
jgi:sec-independent protein translocase protein TatC